MIQERYFDAHGQGLGISNHRFWTALPSGHTGGFLLTDRDPIFKVKVYSGFDLCVKQCKIDGLVRSQKPVTPANAGANNILE